MKKPKAIDPGQHVAPLAHDLIWEINGIATELGKTGNVTDPQGRKAAQRDDAGGPSEIAKLPGSGISENGPTGRNFQAPGRRRVHRELAAVTVGIGDRTRLRIALEERGRLSFRLQFLADDGAWRPGQGGFSMPASATAALVPALLELARPPRAPNRRSTSNT